MIHVFIGTKAQYIKMAPLLRRMDDEQVSYRLIDSGQHARLTASLRAELGVREPDVALGRGRDIVSIPQALRWASGLAAGLVSAARLRAGIFGGHDGVCVVHGDTPTTLLSVLLAKRAGLAVAVVEAGLRTRRLLHPFPEEIIRMVVPRLADLLFAPGPEAASNLRGSRVSANIVEQSANTVLESIRGVVGDAGKEPYGPAIITMHIVENVHRRERRDALVALVEALAPRMPVRWVMHGHTERALDADARRRLQAAGAELMPLQPHREFLAMIAAAPFVITDGGSVQEECALLGVPTLLWRDCTERPDGLGANVVLSRYDPGIVEEFLRDPGRHRRPPLLPEVSPSAQILAELDAWR